MLKCPDAIEILHHESSQSPFEGLSDVGPFIVPPFLMYVFELGVLYIVPSLPAEFSDQVGNASGYSAGCFVNNSTQCKPD